MLGWPIRIAKETALIRQTSRHAAPLCVLLALSLTACEPAQPGASETAATPAVESAAPSPEDTGATATVPAATAAVTQAGPPPPSGVRVRGQGGLEERCLKEVARQGTTVVGTNRIVDAGAAVEIYVNVEGGQAPWRCRAFRDGRIDSVEYSGSEGDL